MARREFAKALREMEHAAAPSPAALTRGDLSRSAGEV